MKKIGMLTLALLLICGIFSGCGSSVAGTWYSDRDDKAALVLDKDGTYSDGEWLTGGKYTIDGDTILLTSTLDGQNTLTIQKQNGKTVLVLDTQSPHTYYDNAEDAQAAIETRQAAEKAAAEEQAAKEREALQSMLLGYWYSTNNYPVEFTTEGKYNSYSLGKLEESQYEVISGNKISVTAADGTKQEIAAEIKDDGHLQLGQWNYIKSTPLDLSLELLAGEWTDGLLSTVFTADSTYIEKSAFPGFVEDTVVAFTITGSNTLDAPDQGGQQWAFLSETSKEYQLILSKIKRGVSYVTFITKSK